MIKKNSSTNPTLKKEDMHDMFVSFQRSHSPELREKLILANTPLAYWFVLQNFSNYPQYTNDLLQESMMALEKCVDGYDPSKDKSFATYAIPAMYRVCAKFLRNTSYAFRMSETDYMEYIALKKAYDGIYQKMMKEPDVDIIADTLKWAVSKVKQCMTAAQQMHVVSLDEDMWKYSESGSRSSSLADSIADPNQIDPNEYVCGGYEEDCKELVSDIFLRKTQKSFVCIME